MMKLAELVSRHQESSLFHQSYADVEMLIVGFANRTTPKSGFRRKTFPKRSIAEHRRKRRHILMGMVAFILFHRLAIES